jgi:hypothetical protein
MPKKTQKRNRRIRRKSMKKSMKVKRSNKRFKKYIKGGVNEKVKCCMCERDVDKNNTLIPRECLINNGSAAHRICQDCWWNPEYGFAREYANHKCPGCIKKLPLTDVTKNNSEVIDLTLDE